MVEEALRRRKIFENLDKYLETLVKVVKELDSSAEVYLFGSVAEQKHLLTSDVDVLVLTKLKPEEVISRLWEHGIEDPFEIHVRKPRDIEAYGKRTKLVKLA